MTVPIIPLNVKTRTNQTWAGSRSTSMLLSQMEEWVSGLLQGTTRALWWAAVGALKNRR
ncbi:hypothetical protein Gogos_009850 [Gossypium gossypioides]|uniref:Uncharacterized protein n=1 Tax=Gossypium gossypioides TaxID=34282 RepID=A0A7J9BJB4_GOSGO|nr:hypothetical protein [Gossypium gossypioides]